MNILLCHNYYQQPGGEDRCHADEADLLQSHGHQVTRYERNNDHIGGLQAVATAGNAIWNRQTYREIRQIIRDQRIDVVQCTNTFPVISPSIYYACSKERVPVIQTLQNYRLFCANAYFLRDGNVCEKCLHKAIATPAIHHGCYRGSRFASAAVVAMQSIHRMLGSWTDRVDQFIVPTEFAKNKFISGGLPEERISIKPNFVAPDPGIGKGDGNYALFAGRLSEEKGLRVLIKAWETEACNLELRVIGGGPMEDFVRSAARENPKIKVEGFQTPETVFDRMKNARFVVVPSMWYEGLPRSIIESFAVGTPVIASDIGPLSELVRENAGGLRFELGSPESLAKVAGQLCTDQSLAQRLRVAARKEFEAAYSAATNYQCLIEIYRKAIDKYSKHPLSKAKRRLSADAMPHPST